MVGFGGLHIRIAQRPQLRQNPQMAQPVIAAQFLRHVANCLELTGRSAAGLLA